MSASVAFMAEQLLLTTHLIHGSLGKLLNTWLNGASLSQKQATEHRETLQTNNQHCSIEISAQLIMAVYCHWIAQLLAHYPCTSISPTHYQMHQAVMMTNSVSSAKSPYIDPLSSFPAHISCNVLVLLASSFQLYLSPNVKESPQAKSSAHSVLVRTEVRYCFRR